ncbi:MAG: hypothetical protein ACK45F_06865 [bacterium]
MAHLKAARDLALNGDWQREDNMQLMVKYTGARIELLRPCAASGRLVHGPKRRKQQGAGRMRGTGPGAGGWL